MGPGGTGVKIGVAGLWHLGTVTAGCLASAGFEVTAYDGNAGTTAGLREGRLPVAEPGLGELIAKAVRAGHLRFSSFPSDLLGVDLLWVAYDTPVDDEGRADVESVLAAVEGLFPVLADGALVLVSSQLPIGSTRRLEERFRQARPGAAVSFAYSPENLRLGKAIEVFTQPDRVVVGIRDEKDRERVAEVLKPFTDRIVWMSVESAEMTKHALNAFLATSVVFANELAVLCERMKADAREVEAGLKSDVRIGPRAYLGPGGPFAGGTLARDVSFLIDLGLAEGLPTPLMSAVREGNDLHRQWARRRLVEIMGDVRGKTVAALGLTYKPGTDTLRGSNAVETSRWLKEKGARIVAYDPAVRSLPGELASLVELRESYDEALTGADAALVSTEWPELRALTADQVVLRMRSPLVVDPGGFLRGRLGDDRRIRYVTVGRPS
jgi:UDPglucose 6-dehydrogenase